jgi:serine/threonine protein kinase
MPSYCCFVCPQSDYIEKRLKDKCPLCGNEYGFPILSPPAQLREFRIVKPIARGFYASTYIVEYGALNQQVVLRVTSKAIYKFFKKDFEAECKIHAEISQESEHLVRIRDMFDWDVEFGSLRIPCHVAVLDLAQGDTLKDYLDKGQIPARTIAQIGIDLFRIIDELQNRGIYHNDLRGENIIIKQLGDARRAEALDDSIRAVVVDLGSVAGGSISNEDQPRLGDVHWVAHHLSSLAQNLLTTPDSATDLDYRLASLLDERAHLLRPLVTNQRMPLPAECIEDIKNALHQVMAPWQEQLRLKRFDDAYNAQTLEPWFVPLLLVDPDELWSARMSTPGPQVIIGMRGCGKTMLLRSLQFHARATREEEETSESVLARLRRDKFVGLYVSCTRLLDYLGAPTKELSEPYPRLLVAFGLEALRALRHLREISPDVLVPNFHRQLGKAISDYLESDENLANVGSEFELERRLVDIQVSLTRGRKAYSLQSHPSIAFPHLAESILKCTSIWNGHSILFLLDDVSTRYINEQQTQELLSKLLFQHPQCSFKLTTEAQTLEIILRSPGEIEKARLGRDYDVFDLGAEVHEKVKNRPKGAGTAFIESILSRRAKYYPNHPKATPGGVLGDASLASIARRIVTTSEASGAKKGVYHGITALAGVCVGDIGDVISIYELILKKAAGTKVPVGADIQSGCYQDFCSRRLFDLNRRENKLKDVALSFAEASHDLLVQSYESKESNKEQRLRQYTKVYVRITTGDPDKQFERLRTLIDSGVFILAGGSDTPRTKTRDSNPIQQFVLTFRKLFGLSNFIGLSARDRFELSGADLEEWLISPSRGKEILLRNLQSTTIGDELDDDGIDDEEDDQEESSVSILQPKLFEMKELVGDVFTSGGVESNTARDNYVRAKAPSSKEISVSDLASIGIDEVVLGLGFEERCLDSAKRLAQIIKPRSARLVRYSDEGNSKEIRHLVDSLCSEVITLDYRDILSSGMEVSEGNILVDVAGLAKPAIFHCVRNALLQNRKVWFSDTRAQIYYPLEDDISKVLEADRNRDHYTLLEELSKILSGEIGRYEIERLFSSDADESRRRVLCAFSSSKHGRLFTLLDERDFDRIEILVPPKQTPRSKLAQIAADVAVQNYPGSLVTKIDSHDLEGVLNFITERFQQFYVDGGFNFELALTGSKLQAVACAAVAAALKISQCWYVHAQMFDPKRFTLGSGQTTYYEIGI